MRPFPSIFRTVSRFMKEAKIHSTKTAHKLLIYLAKLYFYDIPNHGGSNKGVRLLNPFGSVATDLNQLPH